MERAAHRGGRGPIVDDASAASALCAEWMARTRYGEVLPGRRVVTTAPQGTEVRRGTVQAAGLEGRAALWTEERRSEATE